MRRRYAGNPTNMKKQAMRRAQALLTAFLIGMPTAAFAQANCRNTGSFDAWLADFKKEAISRGISKVRSGTSCTSSHMATRE